MGQSQITRASSYTNIGRKDARGRRPALQYMPTGACVNLKSAVKNGGGDLNAATGRRTKLIFGGGA